MDFCDIASQAEEMQREQALATQRALARVVKLPPGESAKWCEGEACGVRIPEARRRAVPGVRLCVECQARAEQRATNHEPRRRAGP